MSAQGRKRLYWSNIPIRPIEDKHIYLSDIVHENTDEADVEAFKVKDSVLKTIIKQEIESGLIEEIGVGKLKIVGKVVDITKDKFVFPEDPPQRIKRRSVDTSAFRKWNKSFTLTVSDRHGVFVNGYSRLLTPIECERLQGLPDNYSKFGENGKLISNNQRWNMLGNGWTATVIARIFESIPKGF